MKKYFILLFLLSCTFLTACSVKKVEEVTDGEKFAMEYDIPKDNPFIYFNTKEMLSFMENGSGIIYFGFPECPWCVETISILEDVLEEKNVDKVYYYNPKKIREKNTKSYQKLLKILGENLLEDESGNPKLYVPDIYVLEKGKIIAHDNSLSVVSGNVDDYLTEEKRKLLKKDLTKLVAKYTVKECTNCN